MHQKIYMYQLECTFKLSYIQYSCCILADEADELYRYTPWYPEHAAGKTKNRKISVHCVVWLQRIFIVSSVETSLVEVKNNNKIHRSIGLHYNQSLQHQVNPLQYIV